MLELEKMHYFLKVTFLPCPFDIILLKPTNFFKTGVHGKYILVSSRTTRLLYLKFYVDIINQEFLF